MKKPEQILTHALMAIKADCVAWLDGEMDSLDQNELLMAFANMATDAMNAANETKNGESQ